MINMKKRFSEEQIIRILKEHEAGKKAADIVREYDLSPENKTNRKVSHNMIFASPLTM